MQGFDNTSEFVARFHLIGSDYYDPVPLQDRRVAFSVKRKYPVDIRYKPARKENGEPDNVSALWVVYAHPSEAGNSVSLEKVPVRVRIANMSQYLSKHFDYNDDDPESPTRDSLQLSASTPKPMELGYEENFFYDHSTEAFVDRVGETISGLEMLDRVFADHCDTVHWFRGAKVRAKLAAQSKAAAMLAVLIGFLKFSMKYAFGRTLEPDDSVSAFLRGYPRQSFRKLSEDSLNLFGYRAAKPVVVLFAAIMCVFALLYYAFGDAESDIGPESYLSYVADNATLTLVHALLLLWVLDTLAPLLLFHSMNFLIRLRTKVLLWRIKAP